MLTLYQYLVQKLLPEQVEKELQGGAVAAAQRHGRFILPQNGIRNQDDLQTIPKVHLMLEDDTESKQYYLIIYRTLSATVCFTVDGGYQFNNLTYWPMPAVSHASIAFQIKCRNFASKGSMHGESPTLTFCLFIELRKNSLVNI